MKKLLMAILVLGSSNHMLTAGGWTPVSQAQAERNSIMYKIKQIRDQWLKKQAQIAGVGAGGSSGYRNAEQNYHSEIFNLLKNIGTPVSYQILQEMCASGALPKSYLGQA